MESVEKLSYIDTLIPYLKFNDFGYIENYDLLEVRVNGFWIPNKSNLLSEISQNVKQKNYKYRLKKINSKGKEKAIDWDLKFGAAIRQEKISGNKNNNAPQKISGWALLENLSGIVSIEHLVFTYKFKRALKIVTEVNRGEYHKLYTPYRYKEVRLIRQIGALYLHELGYGCVQIALFFKQNHATVIHSIKKIKSDIQVYSESKELLNQLKSLVA